MAHCLQRLSCKTTTLLLAAWLLTAPVAAQQPAPSGNNPPADEGQQKMREGRHAEALAYYKKVLADTPNSYQANNQAGVALDLLGQYEEARKHFDKAIAAAPDAESKSRATRNMPPLVAGIVVLPVYALLFLAGTRLVRIGFAGRTGRT